MEQMLSKGLIIAIIVIVAVLVFITFCVILYIKITRKIKRKIQNKIVDVGADILIKTAGKVLDEKTASKVSHATTVTAEILKKENLMAAVAKKGLEIAMDTKKTKKLLSGMVPGRIFNKVSLGEKTMICPYYNSDSKVCNFLGTSQEESQKENYCLSNDNWKRCANYEEKSYKANTD